MSKPTPKNFILQLGALIALYISVISILILIFSITNLKFPDEIANYWESNGSRDAVRNSIAMLIVFFPTYLIFTRLSNQNRRKQTAGEYGTLSKWLVYISILIGILVLLGNMVTLILYFLNGEITSRFLLKVSSLSLVIGMTLSYYTLDVRGYFKKRIDKSMYFGIGALILVLTSVICGYSFIETPKEVREIRLDEKQVNDLQQIYWNVEEAYRYTLSLPETINALYINQKAPTAPESREAYVYTVLSDNTFELCATFVTESNQFAHPEVDTKVISKKEDEPWFQNNNWEHGIGETCFTRTVRESKELRPVFLN